MHRQAIQDYLQQYRIMKTFCMVKNIEEPLMKNRMQPIKVF